MKTEIKKVLQLFWLVGLILWIGTILRLTINFPDFTVGYFIGLIIGIFYKMLLPNGNGG